MSVSLSVTSSYVEASETDRSLTQRNIIECVYVSFSVFR